MKKKKMITSLSVLTEFLKIIRINLKKTSSSANRVNENYINSKYDLH